MKTTTLAFILVVTLFVAGCGDDDTNDTSTDPGDDTSQPDGDSGDGGSAEPDDDGAEPDTSDPLGDGTWQLISGTADGTDLSLLDSHPITIVATDDGIGGTAACNSYGGTAVIDGDSITLDTLFQTEMACMPDETMALESAYLAALSRVDTIAVDGTTLTLTGEGVTLTFEAQEPPADADLENTAWTLDSIIDGDSVSSTMMGVGSEPTMTIVEGTITGSTGCNTFNGTVTVGDDALEIGPLATTRMGCEDGLMAQETAVLAVLSGNPAFTIEGPSLTLTLPDGRGLVYRAD